MKQDDPDTKGVVYRFGGSCLFSPSHTLPLFHQLTSSKEEETRHTKAEEEAVLVTQHLCKVRGLLFDTVSFKDSAEGVCRGVKKAFQGAHIYITSDNDDDVRTAHRQFFRWKKC